MGWLKNAWSKLKTKTAMTSETVEASIHTQMWTAGYSDAEIEFAINDYRESLVSPRLGNYDHPFVSLEASSLQGGEEKPYFS